MFGTRSHSQMDQSRQNSVFQNHDAFLKVVQNQFHRSSSVHVLTSLRSRPNLWCILLTIFLLLHMPPLWLVVEEVTEHHKQTVAKSAKRYLLMQNAS